MSEGLRICSVKEEVEFEIDTKKAGPGTLQTTFDGTAQLIDFQCVLCGACVQISLSCITGWRIHH